VPTLSCGTQATVRQKYYLTSRRRLLNHEPTPRQYLSKQRPSCNQQVRGQIRYHHGRCVPRDTEKEVR
jgi:hypothetical protein